MRTNEAATGREIMSDSVAGGIAGAGLGGLMGYGITDAGLRGARRSRNRFVRSIGRAKGFRQAAAGLAGMTAAGVGGVAGSMAMGGHTWFNGVPKEGSEKPPGYGALLRELQKPEQKRKPGDPMRVGVVHPSGKISYLEGHRKKAGLLPTPGEVLPVKAGAIARAVKPSTIAKNVKSMHAMPAKIAGALSTVIREADVIIPGVASMGQPKKPKGAKPMPKVAFVKKADELIDEVKSKHSKHLGVGAAGFAAGSVVSQAGLHGMARGYGVRLPRRSALATAAGLASTAGYGALHGHLYSKGKEKGVREEKGGINKPGIAGPVAAGLLLPGASLWTAHRIGRRSGHDLAHDKKAEDHESSGLAKATGAAVGGGAAALLNKKPGFAKTRAMMKKIGPEGRAAVGGKRGIRAIAGTARAANVAVGAGIGALGAHMLTRKPVQKEAEEQMPKFEFVKKGSMGSHGGMNGQGCMSSGATHGGMAGGGKKKGYSFKKKAAEGEKTAAGQAAEGTLENGSLSAAMASFLGIKADDVRMAIDTSNDGDGGRR